MRKTIARRDFVRALGAASAALVLPGLAGLTGCAASPSRSGDADAQEQAAAAGGTTRADVVVIGAGISGLAAAASLEAEGKSVIVLEASDRIGGRIHTDRSLGSPVDLGASWIHGTSGNPITELARRYGVETVPTDYESITLFEGTSRRTELTAWDDYDTVFDALYEASEEAKERGGADLSIEAVLEDAVRSTSPSAAAAGEWGYFLGRDVECGNGADLAEVSLMQAGEGEESAGGDVLFPGGYDAIVRGLAKGLDVRTEQIVTKVTRTSRGVTVTTRGARFEARKVIVTVSLGVLQKGLIDFAPKLPADKLRAIERLGMGVLDKVALRFERPFWSADDTEWLGRVTPRRNHWSSFLNFQHVFGEPVLLAFTAGTFAKDSEARSEEDVTEEVLEALRSCYGASVPAPTGVVRSRWASNPFTHGSYSFYKVGSTPEDREALARAVDDELFFAGEATELGHWATVDAAYLSGLRAAREVLG